MTTYFKAAWSANYTKSAIEGLNLFLTDQGRSGVGDFNGDGHADLLISYVEDSIGAGVITRAPEGRLVLLYGRGDGTFVDATATLPNDGEFDMSIRKIGVADLNGDGIDDVGMAVNWENGRSTDDGVQGKTNATEQIALLSQNGSLVSSDLGFSTWGHGFAIGDINNDGRADVIVGGFTLPFEGATTATAAFTQEADGTLTRTWLEDRGGLSAGIGDFDGDDEAELLDYYTNESGASGLRMSELKADLQIDHAIFSPETYERIESGVNWNGPTDFKIRIDDGGHEYIDAGVHDFKVGDLDGDGRDDVVAYRAAAELQYVDGVLNAGATRDLLELYTLGADGFEPMKGSIRGWTSSVYGVSEFKLIDWNGDGHLDIFVDWPFDTESDPGVGAHIFLNDGTGSFDRLKQSLLPVVSRDHLTNFDPIDANGDGIMDLFAKPAGYDRGWDSWGKYSETMYLGTTRFYTGPHYTDPALRGAAGFNEQYYLNTHADAASAVAAHAYKTGLDHYLAVGKKHGYFGFAVDTHIFGSDKADTIKAREGEERLDGGLGKDKLTGGGSSDTFVFSTKLGVDNVDTIKDFKRTEGDLIALDSDIFKKVGATLDEGEFFAKKGAVKAHDKSDRIIYDSKSGKLFYDDDGNKKHGHDAVLFATLDHKPALDHGDFTIA